MAGPLAVSGKDIVRIGSGSGSWGNDTAEPRELLTRTRVDYLMMDYLAEITLSIMRRQMDRDPDSGFATDILEVVRDILPLLAENGTRLVTNAGGLNPIACGNAIRQIVDAAGFGDKIRVAIVDGDDLMPQLPALAESNALTSMDDGRAFAQIEKRVVSANAYIGAGPIRDALALGADIVITGRCVDVALALGPLMHEFGWAEDDWDRLGAGVVAGHLLECGPQSTGGNHQGWQAVPGLEHVGYPIVEVGRDGRIVLTKAPNTGGMVTVATATDQLLHEIADPRSFMSPDVIVDWTSFTLTDLGQDRVLIAGVRGRAPTDSYRVSFTYRDGYRVILMWPYAWPNAVQKAEAALKKIAHTVERKGLRVDASRSDIFGTGAIHGRRLAEAGVVIGEPVEVIARYAARTNFREDANRLASQQAPMHYGPPGMAGQIAGGKGQVAPIYSHWPALVPKSCVRARTLLLS